MKICRLISLLVLLVGASNMQAQTILQAEQQIKDYLAAISYWRFEYNKNDTTFSINVSQYDSLDTYNRLLESYLMDLANTMPAMLSAPLKSFEDSDLTVITSPDKKMRIYTWDMQTGGTMRFFNSVFQYSTSNGTKGYTETKTETDAGPLYDDLYVVKTNSNKSYYLAIYKSIFSTKDVSRGIKAFSIEGDELKEATIFHASKVYSNISYAYDYFSNYSYDKMQEEYIVHLSKNNKKLYIPIIDGDQMTGRWLVYVFDGEKFVYDKKAK